MAQLLSLEESQFHPGEQAMHNLLHIQQRYNPTHHDLPQALGYRVGISPLVAFGTLDRQGRPWATLWGGEAGFCRPIARDVLGVRATADVAHDPVLRGLLENEKSGEVVDDAVVQPEDGKIMAGLSVDPETRDRVKIMGRMVVGTVNRTDPGIGELQLAVKINGSLGNCPKYISKKHIVPHIPKPQLVSKAIGKSEPLPKEALEVIGKSDTFFIASKFGNSSMDTNIRGGSPGFVRVLRNSPENDGGVSIVYPEYSGNRLYQTLGNLYQYPEAGLVIPDYDTGDVLYVTGKATILVGEKANKVMPRIKLAVRIDVTEGRFVRNGLPFRGTKIDLSPYNPAVRPLASEKESVDTIEAESGDGGIATARLVNRRVITPTVSQYVFKLAGQRGKKGPLKAWLPGHHVTLDFAPELDIGYSHMRDDDPQSLNDDFVRTFTVSRPLDPNLVDENGYVKEDVEPEFEITVRRHGPATRFLERWNMRAPLEIPVLGFGGAEGFRLPTGLEEGGEDTASIFVAAGVGITPLMAQAAGIIETTGGKGLRLLWSLKGEDLPLAVDVLERINGLGEITKLFITGKIGKNERAWIATVQSLGAEVLERRIDSADLLSEGEKAKRKFYCCTGPGMMKALLKWTEGEKVIYESFEY
ncbi:hypothetical protein F5Y13DRAFT_119720 [Hypoxylon sp. FL1857]|nr:hypothetical protein F5Y13DRAFT_119720 [Hypoxylon sp. FL1857]